MRSVLTILFICFATMAEIEAKEIKTNEVVMPDAPSWLLQTRVEKVTNRIQSKLEWSTRRVNVYWYGTQAEFDKVQSFGPQAAAVTKKEGEISTVHMGPTVTNENFDAIFGHELVHVIINQKYKDAVPKWLEEGLANHLAARSKVDYKWLAQQPFPSDVHELAHPFSGSATGVSYRYKASQALAEMLAKKCDLENLIRLSVQRKMDDYIRSFCEIPDLNISFREWVKKKSQSNVERSSGMR